MYRVLHVFLLASILVVAGCSYATETGDTSTSTVLTPRGPVSMDKNDYSVFPDADAGADPSVSAEDGGAGFTGEGWETNLDFELIGDPRAVKGGSYRTDTSDFPGTLRVFGPDTTILNQVIHNMAYETLLGMDPRTLEYIPALATHWQLSEDQLTYRFRLNPNARFSDGEPVTSEDVVASWDLIMDPATQAPNYRLIFGDFERPVAESLYIFSIRAKETSWLNLVDLAQLWVFPAHYVETLEEDDYLREYNYKLMPGSGPYMVNEDDIDRGNSITIRRRNDYWAEDHRANVGLNNFDEITEVVVRDRNLAFEVLKRGDSDLYLVSRAQMWVEELEFDRIQTGWLQKRKIFTQEPQSIQGLAFNTRRAPFDDIRVRQALTLLFDRERLIENLYYNEYLPQNSTIPGSIYENPNNPANEYDPQQAIQLLREAGWQVRDTQGRLVRNGQPLNVELIYASQQSEPFLTVLQEDLRRVGITLNLRLLTYATLIKLLDERNFDLVQIGYVSGKPFPFPESLYRSELADQPSSNNITGIKDPRIDAALDAYEAELDIDRRTELLREVDGLVTNHYLFMLQWYAPYHRVVYWNKFGQPEGYLSRDGDYLDIMTMWWVDPEKQAALEEARGNGTSLEVGPSEIRYWLEFENPLDSGPSNQ